MLQPAFSEIAPAKINLYLHVTGVRGDGLHELDSLVVFADAADRVAALATDEAAITLSLDGPFAGRLEADDRNLVSRAARLLAAQAGISAGAHLTLEKNLPVAAGLGGGSADAAAALRALIGAWGLGKGADDDPVATLADLWGGGGAGRAALFETLARELGADVPVCLSKRAQFVSGIGERLAPAGDLPPLWLVLANPGVALSTARVFQALDARAGGETANPALDVPPPEQTVFPQGNARELARALAQRKNDLEAAAIALEPAIGQVISHLQALAGSLLVRMSGSGATAFALFAEAETARAAARRLARAQPGWWVTCAGVLG